MSARILSGIRHMHGLRKLGGQSRDRVIADIQAREGALTRLAKRAVLKAAVLSLEKHAFCPEEISAASIDGVEFSVLPDIPDILASTAVFDFVLLCCHVRGEESVLFELRRRRAAAFYAAWFFDNHHHHVLNLRTAMLADLIFVSHWHESQYLNIPMTLPGTHLPAYSRQWSPGAIARHFPEGLPAQRRDGLFGGFNRYAWAVERNRFIEALRARCPEHSLGLVGIDEYFRIPFAERLRAWVEHKVHLIVPVNRDVTSRVFESLMTGQIPLVPEDVPDLDRLIGADRQAMLPILRYRAGDVESAIAAWRAGLSRFDDDGPEGVRRRHEFARDGHSLTARLGRVAAFIRHPGPHNLTGNGKVKFWDSWG